jgi:hypothetical protein
MAGMQAAQMQRMAAAALLHVTARPLEQGTRHAALKALGW